MRLVFILLLGFSFSVFARELGPPSGVSKEEFQKAHETAKSLQIAFRAVHEFVRPSVVQVIVEKTQTASNQQFVDPFLNDPIFRRFFGIPENPRDKDDKSTPSSLGSGFIIDESGWIVTNFHVVAGSKKVKVRLSDGREIEGNVRGSDQYTDIALIDITKTKKGKLEALSFGNSDKIAVGDFAIAVGNPFGLEGTFTTGVISAVGRAGLDKSGIKFIQTDASINQGNSGGPLLNLDGEVIGINRMIVSPTGGSVGIGFAIPANEIKNVIEQIKLHGKVERPFLGVQITTMSEEQRKLAGSGSVIVERVVKDSSADKAGIKSSDVLLKVDNLDLEVPDQLVGYILKKRVGDTIKLLVLRSGKRLEITARLGVQN